MVAWEYNCVVCGEDLALFNEGRFELRPPEKRSALKARRKLKDCIFLCGRVGGVGGSDRNMVQLNINTFQ